MGIISQKGQRKKAPKVVITRTLGLFWFVYKSQLLAIIRVVTVTTVNDSDAPDSGPAPRPVLGPGGRRVLPPQCWPV